MNLLHEDLARAHYLERQREAREQRRHSDMALALRLAQRAERVANQARLHLARSLC